MQVARRHCWADEDRPRPLMPCSDPLWLVEAPLALARLTGIDVNSIPECEVSVFSLPLAEDDWAERGLRRWAGTRADAMWHPLLWLPARLAAPTVAVTSEGVAVEESLERWQARVAFEIINSGLYTDDGWVDVYALLGMALENPTDVARVEVWLDGRPDETLDRFSLDAFFAADHHDVDARSTTAGRPGGDDLDRAVTSWSAALAADTASLLVSSARALMADSLLSLAYDLTGPTTSLDDDAYARGAWWLTSLAIEAVSDTDTADAWLAALDAVQAAGTDRQMILLALQPSLELLTVARDAYWPALAELQQFAADLNPSDAAPVATPADQPAVLNLAGARPSSPVPSADSGLTATGGRRTTATGDAAANGAVATC